VAQPGVRDLVEFIVRALVDHPEAVQVRQLEGERTIILELRVAPEDVGKVIGRQGRIVNALRTVVRAAAVREGKRVTLEVLQ
jgi:predicted RNA-binding protein YlqC (UPF0109 family)